MAPTRSRRSGALPCPACGTALLSGGLLAFGLSFDEIIVTIFTAGAGTQTMPMWIYSAIQRPNELPVVNVVALVLVLISVIPVYSHRASAATFRGVASRLTLMRRAPSYRPQPETAQLYRLRIRRYLGLARPRRRHALRASPASCMFSNGLVDRDGWACSSFAVMYATGYFLAERPRADS